MSTDARMEALRRLTRQRFPTTDGMTPADRDRFAAAIADVEAKISAALALFLQGDGDAALALIDVAHATAGDLNGLPVVAAFSAAADAVSAAADRDHDRGMAAVNALRARTAEFAATSEQLLARHAEGNAG